MLNCLWLINVGNLEASTYGSLLAFSIVSLLHSIALLSRIFWSCKSIIHWFLLFSKLLLGSMEFVVISQLTLKQVISPDMSTASGVKSTASSSLTHRSEVILGLLLSVAWWRILQLLIFLTLKEVITVDVRLAIS